MQIDKDMLNKFLGLSDEEFKKKVTDAAKTAGIENSKLNDIMKDTKHIKSMIGSMSEDDIKKALQSVGDEKIAQMIQNLQNKK
ncbi:MAG: hypothetical protein FWD71_12545 [Oscillospiraceae bacterium]|nr:hypothetical protein [Oscillospiraceae bacterium]